MKWKLNKELKGPCKKSLREFFFWRSYKTMLISIYNSFFLYLNPHTIDLLILSMYRPQFILALFRHIIYIKKKLTLFSPQVKPTIWILWTSLIRNPFTASLYSWTLKSVGQLCFYSLMIHFWEWNMSDVIHPKSESHLQNVQIRIRLFLNYREVAHLWYAGVKIPWLIRSKDFMTCGKFKNTNLLSI